jgi:hypothetical protein
VPNGVWIITNIAHELSAATRRKTTIYQKAKLLNGSLAFILAFIRR